MNLLKTFFHRGTILQDISGSILKGNPNPNQPSRPPPAEVPPAAPEDGEEGAKPPEPPKPESASKTGAEAEKALQMVEEAIQVHFRSIYLFAPLTHAHAYATKIRAVLKFSKSLFFCFFFILVQFP